MTCLRSLLVLLSPPVPPFWFARRLSRGSAESAAPAPLPSVFQLGTLSGLVDGCLDAEFSLAVTRYGRTPALREPVQRGVFLGGEEVGLMFSIGKSGVVALLVPRDDGRSDRPMRLVPLTARCHPSSP